MRCCWLKKSLILLGLSTRKEFVTTPTRLWGGVVPRLCVFSPDPARPGDPPGRLLEIPTNSFRHRLHWSTGTALLLLVHESIHPDIHHDAQCEEREQHRRPAIAHQRQRNSGDWHQTHDHPHIYSYLEDEHCDDAHNQ